MYFIDYAITVVSFFLPFIPLHPAIPDPPALLAPALSSCPLVVHISSLASPFPILFLTSPYLVFTYQFLLLNPCTFSPISPFPTDNPPNDLHIYDSVPVLLLCLVCFLDSDDSCKCVVILMFIVLTFFFLNKSL